MHFLFYTSNYIESMCLYAYIDQGFLNTNSYLSHMTPSLLFRKLNDKFQNTPNLCRQSIQDFRENKNKHIPVVTALRNVWSLILISLSLSPKFYDCCSLSTSSLRSHRDFKLKMHNTQQTFSCSSLSNCLTD